MIFRVCLIIANAICLAVIDSKISKILNVLAIAFMSISFFGEVDNTTKIIPADAESEG